MVECHEQDDCHNVYLFTLCEILETVVQPSILFKGEELIVLILAMLTFLYILCKYIYREFFPPERGIYVNSASRI